MAKEKHNEFDIRNFWDKQLIQKYQGYLPRARAYWNAPEKEDSKRGVDGSTSRAYRAGGRGKDGPQHFYDNWANKQLSWLDQRLNSGYVITNKEDFEELHSELVTSFVDAWGVFVKKINDENKAPLKDGTTVKPGVEVLAVAHRYKMVDLFFRYYRVIAATSKPKSSTRTALAAAILEYGHIPLDRKSLAVLSAMYSHIGVNSTFRMGDVESEGAYQTYQQLARLICKEAGGSPLLLDVFSLKSDDAKLLYTKLEKESAQSKGKASA